MEAFLSELLARHLDPAVAWRPIDYGSKQQLLARLPSRLNGYSKIPIDARPLSLVLVDRDDDDCLALKARLELACADAHLGTPGNRAALGGFEVVNRIVVEELEAWYFGDNVALAQLFPKLHRIAGRAAYRNPDAIAGGTHEAFFREIQAAGYARGLTRLPKIETARRMGRLVEPQRNVSPSFRHFWNGLGALAATA